MGYGTALGFAEFAGADPSDHQLGMAINAHLRSNCFPPVDSVWVGPAVKAVKMLAGRVRETRIRHPFAKPKMMMSAAKIVAGLRLDAFVDTLTRSDNDENS